jgi:hypothetical protein
MCPQGRPAEDECRKHQQDENYHLSFDMVGIAQIDPATGRFLHVNAKLCAFLKSPVA